METYAQCDYLQVPENKVVELLNKREVKKYIDTVYLDMGYRNKNNIASVLDEMIASKLEEAQESGVYSNKDLADLSDGPQNANGRNQSTSRSSKSRNYKHKNSK